MVMNTEDLPTREQFKSWLEHQDADQTRDINACDSCYLTQFMRDMIGDQWMSVCIDSVYCSATRVSCPTPEWMFNFQANAIYAPGWYAEGAERVVQAKRDIQNTNYTPAQALEILARC
jgi:hypothetical protein